MDSKTIVEKYNTKDKGQQWLWENYDRTLRHTNFQPVNADFDREALVHFWMNVYVPSEAYGEFDTPYEVYKTWHNAIYGRFNYITAEAYHPETNQQAISFSCYKSIPTEDHLAELKMWLPYIKETTDENGHGKRKAKRIRIFEDSLSAGGIFGLTIYNEMEIVIDKITHGFYKVLKKFNNLYDAVDYIREHIWYKKEHQ